MSMCVRMWRPEVNGRCLLWPSLGCSEVGWLVCSHDPPVSAPCAAATEVHLCTWLSHGRWRPHACAVTEWTNRLPRPLKALLSVQKASFAPGEHESPLGVSVLMLHPALHRTSTHSRSYLTKRQLNYKQIKYIHGHYKHIHKYFFKEPIKILPPGDKTTAIDLVQ